MRIFLRTLVLIVLYYVIGCNPKEVTTVRPFFDANHVHIGDSIFVNGEIRKINFVDSLFEIDSVVFSRYDNASRTIKSINTFEKGHYVFENIEYYENGKIQKYLFIDEENDSFFYERSYDITGKFLNSRGYVFFQGFIIDTVSKADYVKRGTTLTYRIYYPNPPDCETKLFIADEHEEFEVFRKSRFINFLQTALQDNDESGTFKATIGLKIKDRSTDSIITYKNDLIIQVKE